MYDFGRWAVFLIVLTNAVANSARNENETANGVFKSSRIVFPSPAEEKRFRQRWDNLTLASKLKSASNSAAVAAAGTSENDSDVSAKKTKNIIEEIVRQTQHPVKKQIKYKRLRYLSSADQNNGTKLGPPPAPPPTSSPVDESKDDTKDFKPAAFKFTDSDSFRRHPSNETSGGPSSTSPRLVHDAKVQTAADTIFSSSQRTTAVQNGVPSHRKKRRRLPTSASIVVPLAMSTYEQQPLHHHHVPRDPHNDPFLDFGKKISVTAASYGRTPHANTIEGVRSPVVRFGAASAAAEEPDGDKTDRLFVAGSSLQQNYYRGSVVKPTPAGSGILNTSLCVPNHRTGPLLRPGFAAKGSKREIDANGTLCRLENGASSVEGVERGARPKVELPVTSTAVMSTSELPFSAVVSSSPSTTSNPATHQLTTKILSTAVITSVSIKSNERISRHKLGSSTSTPVKDVRTLFELPTTFHRKAEITSSSKPFELRISGSSREYTAVPQARHANLSKQYATITRNAVPPYARVVVSTTPTAPSQNVTQATTPESTTATADPNIQYLMHSTSKTSAAEDAVAETTTVSWNWRNPVESSDSSSYSTSSSEEASKNQSLLSSPSTPLFVTYEDKDAGNLIYHVRNDSLTVSSPSSLDNSTGHPSTVFTIFTKNVHHHNYTNKNLLHTSNVIAGEQNGDGEDVVDDVGDDGQTGFRIVTYVLAGLGAIPLVIGIALVTKMLLSQNKKQIFEGSEYSSEYNRNTLEFNAGVTSSPIATKLPRVSHQAHWEIEKKSNPSISLPNNSQWEFPRSKLRLQTILGQGNFGQVWKAEADDINGHEGLTRLVAVKMVKEISSTREKEDLIKELIIMQHLGTHPNVVTLLGCCTEKEPYMLIMEYVMYGKLLSFLRDHRTRTHYFNFSDNGDTLTSRDLTVFAYCVARGMEYLQNKQVIHRDLAARNILIDHNKLCKIADFGMSRYVEESGQVYEHRQSKGALPIRWMSPESLQYSCYNHKTDVWSFGILMWEIVTLGSMPYASMGARLVMRKVKEGYRLEKPKYCKMQLFNVISKCWHADPNKRPTFTELKQELYELLENPEHLGNYVDLEGLAEDMNQIVHGSHNEKFII